MVVDLNELLIVILLLLVISLVIIFMILGIKLIKTLKKVDEVIADVNGKMSKVDGVFDIIYKTTDYASSISDKIFGAITNFISILFKKKKGNEDDE